MKGTDSAQTSNFTAAVYKGLTVTVYTVNKTEINLTRQDLIELINVCTILRMIKSMSCYIVQLTECNLSKGVFLTHPVFICYLRPLSVNINAPLSST